MCFFTTSVRSRRISSGMPISSQMSRSVAIARFRHDTVSAANTSLRAAGTGRQRRRTARGHGPRRAAPRPGSPRRTPPRVPIPHLFLVAIAPLCATALSHDLNRVADALIGCHEK